MSRISRLPLEKVEVPHEPGNYMKFKRLTKSQLDDATAASMHEAMDRFGWTQEDMRSLAGKVDENDPAVKAARRTERESDLGQYSQLKLLEFGLKGWEGESYGEWPTDGTGFRDLDPQTEAWAAQQVLDLSRMAQAKLNGSAPRTAFAHTEPQHESSAQPTPIS